jgi:hypothetical protein
MLIVIAVLGLAIVLLHYCLKYQPQTHFFITTIDRRGVGKARKCWGYEEVFSKAEKAVLANAEDMHEDSNRWVVIEEMVMSACSHPKQGGRIQWYVWEGDQNSDMGRYVKCDAPDWTVNLSSWGIG